MTARDPDLQAAVDRAARELARRFRPWTADSADVDSLARAYVEALYAGPDHWRPVPRQDRIPKQGTADTARAQRGADLARELLAKRTEGDQQ